MKYKVGDKVKIKCLDWYNENKDCYGDIECGVDYFFIEEMAIYCGKLLTIVEAFDGENEYDNIYFMEGNVYKWTEFMIECKVEE